MDALRMWIFRILCTAILCGIMTSLPLGEARGKLLRFVCGVILTMILLSGFPGVGLSELAEEILPDPQAIPPPVAEGEEMSHDAIRQLIIQETEAYILHKAAVLDMEIRVNVTLSVGEYPVPESVVIQGTWTPEQKENLSTMMERELSIPEEDQQWMG